MTRIAFIADIHGNLPALEAVIADIRARGIERIWCLGDMTGKGPSSPEAFDWALANCEIVLQGNWEEGIGHRRMRDGEFYYRQLGEKRLKKMLELPLEYSCFVSGRKMRLFHGRPIMPAALMVHAETPILEPFFDPDFDVVGYADVHRQGMRIVGNRGMIFNTGSVGNGLGLPLAQYAILQGDWGRREMSPFDISLVSLPYDRERALRDADAGEAMGLPAAEAYRKEVSTGRYSR